MGQLITLLIRRSRVSGPSSIQQIRFFVFKVQTAIGTSKGVAQKLPFGRRQSIFSRQFGCPLSTPKEATEAVARLCSRLGRVKAEVHEHDISQGPDTSFAATSFGAGEEGG